MLPRSATGFARLGLHTAVMGLGLVASCGVEPTTGEIDAAAIGQTPAIRIVAPNTTISGLRIGNSRDAAILILAPRATIRDVAVHDSEKGVVLSGARAATLERSVFERNTYGVRIEGTSPGATIRGCTFVRHDGAGIWAVSGVRGDAPVVRIENNTFRDDRISIVLVNLAGFVTQNDIRGALENGIYLMQSRSAVRANRILGGAAGGILGERADDVRIEQNEIDHNKGVGVLIRSSRNATVQGNVIYANAYGLASIFGDSGAPNVLAGNLVMNQNVDGVFIVGGSPLLRANRLLQNGGAAARVLDYVPWSGPRIVSNPRLDVNTLTGNGINAAVRGEYRPKREPVTR